MSHEQKSCENSLYRAEMGNFKRRSLEVVANTIVTGCFYFFFVALLNV